MTDLSQARFDSPIGPLTAVTDGKAVRGLYQEGQRRRPVTARLGRDGRGVLAEVEAQLAGYFAGTLTELDLPLALEGTPFQQAVWALLVAIPYGSTQSYGALARALGRPGAARAVGLAAGRNPVSVVVPCHRLVAGNGGLGGYAGGLANKRWLLDHEAAHRVHAGTARGPIEARSSSAAPRPTP